MTGVTNWEESDFLEVSEIFEQVAKGKERVRKRKWREIEAIKEKQRLKKELQEFYN